LSENTTIWKCTVLCLLVLSMSLSGCTIARFYSTSGNTVAMTSLKQEPGETVTATKRIIFDYTAAIDLQEVLREKVGSGVTVHNVSMKLKLTPVDFLLNLITLGFGNSKTFEITGDVVK